MKYEMPCSLMFASKARAYPMRAPFRIIGPFVSYEEIQHYTTRPRKCARDKRVEIRNAM